MLQISDMMFEGCNLNEITTAVTLDQSSAFDVLKHETLLEKCSLYNFSEEVIKWMRSYLSYRSNYVTIGTKKFQLQKSRTWGTTRIGPRTDSLRCLHQ